MMNTKTQKIGHLVLTARKARANLDAAYKILWFNCNFEPTQRQQMCLDRLKTAAAVSVQALIDEVNTLTRKEGVRVWLALGGRRGRARGCNTFKKGNRWVRMYMFLNLYKYG